MKVPKTLVVILMIPSLASAAVIDFEGIASSEPTEYSFQTAEYNTTRTFGDFDFFVSHGHYEDRRLVRSHGSPSDTFLNDSRFASVLTRTDGGAFSFNSIDVAEWSSNFVGGNILNVSAVVMGGASMSTTRTTDSSPGFETFTFIGWDNLISLSLQNDRRVFSYDNIVVNSSGEAPEPSTLLLLGAGLAGLLVRFEMRKLEVSHCVGADRRVAFPKLSTDSVQGNNRLSPLSSTSKVESS
jgi:hypothetical protein